jgi:VCBS repeat-containing protein
VIVKAKLEVTDIEQGAASLTYSLTAIPANGTLNKSGTALKVGDTFTQDDINSGIITYTHNGSETTSDSFKFTVSDGAGGTIAEATFTITVTAVNDAPVITVPASISATEDVSVTVTGISFSDSDSGSNSVKVTLSVSSGKLSALGGSNETFTLIGSINSANTFIAAGYIKFTPALNDNSDVTLTVTIDDQGYSGSGGAKTVSKDVTISVTPVNDAPVVTASAGTTSFTETPNADSTPVAVDSTITVADVDNTTLASATVSITASSLHSTEDVLTFTNNGCTMGNISASYNAATGILTLTSSGATATLAQWQAALQAVKYTNTSHNPSTDTRTVEFKIYDGALLSVTASKDVSVTPVNDKPVVTASAGTTSFTEKPNADSIPVVIDGSITVSDADNATLASATVSITVNFKTGEDVLAFTNDGSTMGNIAGSYDSASGVLTLHRQARRQLSLSGRRRSVR